MSLAIQFHTMIAMIIMGGWLGVALDTYGRFLKRPKRASWVLFLYDLLFWIVQALLFFYILLLVNEGQLRFYIILAILCGYAAYQSLFRNFYLKFLEMIIKGSIWTYFFIKRLLTLFVVRPIRGLIKLLIAIVLFIGNVFLMLGKLLWKLLHIFFNIIYRPIKWFFKILWRFVPEKFKMFSKKIEGFYVTKKNIIVKWWKNFRK